MRNKLWIIRILICLLFAFCLYYVTLPAINLHNPGFYMYIFMVLVCYIVTSVLMLADYPRVIRRFRDLPKNAMIVTSIVTTVIVLIVITNLLCSPLFNSKSWANRITISEDTTFTDDIKEVDFNKVPLLDKDSSQKLGDRVMGQMSELVSQYYVSNLYTQINYNNEIVRVTPIEYNGFIKWLNNKKHGVLGYIKVNSVTGKAELVKLDKGMKYMPSAYFFKDLDRALRFKYPTTIFGQVSFEIDNEGNPYWVVPTIKYTGVGLKEEINGIILMDPITGKTIKYKVNDIPKWVDQVFSAGLIIDQIDDWGMYKKGFMNSVFSQNGVVQTTDGYNYLIKDDDVYMYTGITSVSTDESNIGFVLTNLRTKETHFYAVPGAEEYSAMASAEGQVQQMHYVSSFPLLINLNGRPTYLLSLKDNAGLVKMYAFVDVTDYQKVVVTDSTLGIDVAANNYLNNANIAGSGKTNNSKEIVIKSINSAIIDGNTYYYIVDMNNQKYKASIKVGSNILPFINNGDKLTVNYNKDTEVIDIVSIK